MDLQEFYEENGVDATDQIKTPRRIVLVFPNKDNEINPILQRLGIARQEMTWTYPKKRSDGTPLDMTAELQCFSPDVVLNVSDAQSITDDMISKAQSAIKDRYVNLHHHDEYSIRDGLGTVTQLSKILQKRETPFCAVTNHGSVGGWIKQYSTCKKSGLKPIFGCEAYLNDYRGDDPEERKKFRSNYHLILLAATEEGFYNLIKIHNDAQLNGFYYKPRTNHDSLKKWGKGIIASSACMSGEIPQLLLAGQDEDAVKAYETYKQAFDEFYIELTLIEMKEQVDLCRKLILFAQKVGAPLIITGDSHYLYPEHAETHDILLLIKEGKTVLDKIENPEEVWNFDARNLYYRSGEEMRQLWREGFWTKDSTPVHYQYEDDVFTESVFNEALENTRRIALKIEDIKLDSSVKLPKMYEDASSVLRAKASEGFKRRGLRGKTYSDRFNYEMDVICKMGFADYFLTIHKIIQDTKEKFGEWSTGFGRGSAGGSLVSYCLELTDIDPIKYGLLFERFLDFSRPDPPDIDTDFDPRIRDWVKQHIVDTFSEEKTCSIGSYQTYKTRAVVLDVARALGLDIREAMEITKEISSLSSFDVETDEGTEEQKIDQMEFSEVCKHYPELGAYFEKYPDVLRHAEVLRNQVKNMGKHAGGVIISNLPLQDKIPVVRDKSGAVVSSWTEGLATHELTEVGLVKFDILGLCLEENTLVKTNKGCVPIKDLDGLSLQYIDKGGDVQYTDDFLLVETGEKDLIEIRLEDGSVIRCSPDHRLFIKVL